MSNYHKPRTFRSLHGCCICRAKSSSSRFTDSDKYEEGFRSCFKIDTDRSGEICNACVLLVKRWKKLPRGSKKNWSHVVDAKSGPNISTKSSSSQDTKLRTKPIRDDPDLKPKKIIKKRLVSIPTYHPPRTPDEHKECQVSSLTYHPPSTPDEDFVSPPFCASPAQSEGSENSTPSSARGADLCSEDVSPFLDLRYWKRTPVCCGFVFIGSNNDLAIDANLYKPCSQHRRRRSPVSLSESRTDTLSTHSSSSVPPVMPDSPPTTSTRPHDPPL